MALTKTTDDKLRLRALDVQKKSHRMTLAFLAVFIISLFFRDPLNSDLYTASVVGVWRTLYKVGIIIPFFVMFFGCKVAGRLNGTELNAPNSEWLVFLVQWMALAAFIPFQFSSCFAPGLSNSVDLKKGCKKRNSAGRHWL